MANINWAQTMTSPPRTFPQMQLIDVEGNEVNIKTLVTKFNVILITLKNVDCPVCPQLLKILNLYGLDLNMDVFVDPFTNKKIVIDKALKRYYRLVLKYDTYFIILCPGTDAEVRDVQLKTPFLDYPFISSYGGANELVKALKIQSSNQEFMPAILQVDSNNLSVSNIFMGRAPGQYFHNYLLLVLDNNRLKQEKQGLACCKSVIRTIDQIKRRIVKCRDGKLGTTWISLSQPSPTERRSVSSEKGIEKASHLNNLPPEVFELIFSHLIDDLKSLVNISSACRLFYISICNVLIIHLRAKMEQLRSALPQNESYGSEDVTRDVHSLDRWSGNDEGVSLSDLKHRIESASNLTSLVQTWTKHWRIRTI